MGLIAPGVEIDLFQQPAIVCERIAGIPIFDAGEFYYRWVVGGAHIVSFQWTDFTGFHPVDMDRNKKIRVVGIGKSHSFSSGKVSSVWRVIITSKGPFPMSRRSRSAMSRVMSFSDTPDLRDGTMLLTPVTRVDHDSLDQERKRRPVHAVGG